VGVAGYRAIGLAGLRPAAIELEKDTHEDPLQPAVARSDGANQTRAVNLTKSPSARGGLLYLLAMSGCILGGTYE
jgi:hypothetical protein